MQHKFHKTCMNQKYSVLRRAVSSKSLSALLAVLLIVSIAASKADDHADHPEAATPVRLDAAETEREIAAAIDFRGDIDIFEIELQDVAQLTISTQGDTDTFASLSHGWHYDSSSDEFITQDDDSGDDRNFTISKELMPGIYFLAVRGDSSSTVGNYTLSLCPPCFSVPLC